MTVRQFLCGLVLQATMMLASAYGQPIVFETEPNDDPLQAQDEVRGAAILRGTASRDDQDVFWWVVGEADSQRLWTVELRSRTSGLVQLDMVRLESDEAVLQEAGLEDGFTGRDDLLQLQTLANQPDSRSGILLVPEGRYVVGCLPLAASANTRSGCRTQGRPAHMPLLTPMMSKVPAAHR